MVAIVLAVSITGCVPTAPEEPIRGPVVSDEEVLPWAREEPIFVVARVSCRTLDVYMHGTRVRTYDAVFGMGGVGKKYQGDRRTPLGLYSITHKYPHDRWGHFLLLDYPNAADALRYGEALATNGVPDDGNGGPVGIGSAIGIHGTDKPDDNARGIDWTFGCISVENYAIDALVRLLPVGTPVLIQE
jgi:murein L,D-transpeptidase YafK